MAALNKKPNRKLKPSLNSLVSADPSLPIRIYCDGVFDLFHYGHSNVFKQIKEQFPNSHLVVGVTGDDSTLKFKGPTILNAEERYASVRHCRYVDEIIEDAPWIITEPFLKENKIDFVAHDDMPYGFGDIKDIYQPIKNKGKFIPTNRTEGISTTELITRIIKNYDLYLWRQIERGVTGEELNISKFEEKRIKIARKITKEMKKIKATIKRVAEIIRNGGLDTWFNRVVEFARSKGIFV